MISNIPFFLSSVQAGFPSPADDYSEQNLNLHDYVVKRPSSTYFVKAHGTSMTGVGIQDGDILIVDRSLDAYHGAIVIAMVDGRFTCKTFDKYNRRLNPAQDGFPSIAMSEDCVITGVVTHSLSHHHVRTC
jgi:DNA polymerase V